MTTKRIVELVAAGVLVVVLFVALYEWHLEIVRGAELNATLASQKQVQSDIDKRVNLLAETMKEWNDQQNQKLTEVANQFKAASSPQQVAALVSQIMGLNKPITFVTPPATPENPHPTPIATLPAEDAPQVKAYVQGCEECRVKLDTAAKNLTYAQEQQKLDEEKLTSVTVERDAAIKAVHGGSMWQRLKHDSKIIVVSVGVGAAVGYAAHR